MLLKNDKLLFFRKLILGDDFLFDNKLLFFRELIFDDDFLFDDKFSLDDKSLVAINESEILLINKLLNVDN